MRFTTDNFAHHSVCGKLLVAVGALRVDGHGAGRVVLVEPLPGVGALLHLLHLERDVGHDPVVLPPVQLVHDDRQHDAQGQDRGARAQVAGDDVGVLRNEGGRAQLAQKQGFVTIQTTRWK